MRKPKDVIIYDFPIQGHQQPAKYFIYKGKQYWKTEDGWLLKEDFQHMGKFGDEDFYEVRVGC